MISLAAYEGSYCNRLFVGFVVLFEKRLGDIVFLSAILRYYDHTSRLWYCPRRDKDVRHVLAGYVRSDPGDAGSAVGLGCVTWHIPRLSV